MIKKIMLAGLTVIWIVGFVISWNIFLAGPNYWFGFLFGLIGFVIALASTFFLGESNHSTTETGYIPVYYTAAFTALMILLNLSFAFIPSLFLRPVLIVANLIIILVYGVLVYGSIRHLQRVKELTEYAPGKMKNTADISQQLSVLLSIAKDANIRQELLKLKETVAYSNNVTQAFSEESEEVFLEQLYKIQEALSNGSDTETILAKIKDAASTWSVRNSRINSTR